MICVGLGWFLECWLCGGYECFEVDIFVVFIVVGFEVSFFDGRIEENVMKWSEKLKFVGLKYFCVEKGGFDVRWSLGGLKK